MIRVVSLLRRKKGTELQNFHCRLRDEVGPLVAYHQTTLGLLRYVQSYRIEDSHTQAMMDQRGGVMEEAFDASIEYWWHSEESLDQALRDKAGRLAHEAIFTAEDQLIEGATSPIWFAHEYPQVSVESGWVVARPKSSIVKSQFPLRMQSTLTIQAAKEYWLHSHGPLIRSLAPSANGLLRYQQVHQFDSNRLGSFALGRGRDTEQHAGLAEGWFDGSVVLPATDQALATSALADERNFMDWTRSSVWNAKEVVFVDRW
jgi:hypothetical protein